MSERVTSLSSSLIFILYTGIIVCSTRHTRGDFLTDFSVTQPWIMPDCDQGAFDSCLLQRATALTSDEEDSDDEDEYCGAILII